MDNENSTEITIPTYNRFEILRIPIPKPTVYKAQKPQSKPPAIIIREPLSKVKPLLPNEHYGVQNNNNGFRLLCNDIDQHKRFMELLTMKRVQLYTHPYASDKTIRYVWIEYIHHSGAQRRIIEIWTAAKGHQENDSKKPQIRRSRNLFSVLQH